MDLQNPKTILVVQIGKIGDMVLTTPLFSELKIIYPESRLIVLASSVNKDIPLNHSSVDEVIIYSKNILRNLFLLNSSLKKIDLWIDTKNNFSKTSELLLKFFKPKKSLGFNFNKNIFDVSLNDFQYGKHAVEINLSPVNYLIDSKMNFRSRPTIGISPDLLEKSESVMQKTPFFKNIIINISAGNESRYLTKEKWTVIINKIHQLNLYHFNLIGLEKDMEIIDYILKESAGMNIQYIKTSGIIETASLVKLCDVVISPDTSVVHLCSAFNKPVIAMYPDVKWNLEKFSPLSDINEIIISGKTNSIDDIKEDVVVERFKKIISKIK